MGIDAAGRTARILLLRALLVVAASLVVAAGVRSLDVESPPVRLLAAADKAIRAGRAGDAIKPLQDIRKLFPQSSAADAAEGLLKRIASIEVLFDRSHEWRGETHVVARYLKSSGIGVTISDASLAHLADRLPDYEVVLIWQEDLTVSFTEEEIVLLKQYVREGGRLLVIGNARQTGRYPIRRLLAAFGCPMRSPQMDVGYGRGKVRFFDNTGLFAGDRLADPRESRDEVIEVFRRVLPYEQLAKSTVDEHVPPENEEAVGPMTLQYSARMTKPAEWIKGFAGKILEQIELHYRDKLPPGMTVRVLPRRYSGWLGGVVFAPGALQAPADVARELARALALYGLFPNATWISYPPWITGGWCDLVGLRACYRIGFKAEAEAVRRGYISAFDPARADQDGIDLSVSRHGRRSDYIGKAQWVLETLEKRHGKTVMSQLRQTLKAYAAAGRLGDALSTRNVIFYLSQALRQDMFGYFKSIGTTALPVKLDYNELAPPAP